MGSSSDKLAKCLIDSMDADIARLKEETKEAEQHVFSEKFENTMTEIMTVSDKKTHSFPVRKLTAAAAVLVLAVGVFGVSANQANASKPGVDILAWVKEYFNFEKGDDSRHNSDVLFEEAQLGNIPEGFNKTGEEIGFNTARLEYANNMEQFFYIYVTRDKINYVQDGEDIEYTLKENTDGYEYAYTYKKGEKVHVLIWDKEEISYKLVGNLEEDKLIAIMNGIQY